MLILRSFPWHSSSPSVIPFLYITPTQNRGSAFGLFQGGVLVFSVLSLAAIGIMMFIMRRIQGAHFAYVGFCLVLGGALGNLFDRVRFHYVVDFLDLKFWPVFNVADMAIVAGMIFIAVDIWRKKLHFNL